VTVLAVPVVQRLVVGIDESVAPFEVEHEPLTATGIAVKVAEIVLLLVILVVQELVVLLHPVHDEKV
jgi:hypothetical protein